MIVTDVFMAGGRMKIEVRVKPGAGKTAVERQADGTWVVKVKVRAQEGRANEAVIKAVADHFGVPKLAVEILRGRKARRKLIEIK